jgi:hypothetical protein
VQDPAALAAAIVESLTQPVDRSQLMGRAKDFAVGTIADQYLAYFNEGRG